MSEPGADLAPWQRELVKVVFTSPYYVWARTELVELEAGRALVHVRPREEMITPWGGFNGGVLNGLLELPAFLALLGSLDQGEFAVTADIYAQHAKALPGDRVIQLEGRLLRRGRSLAWAESTASIDGQAHSFARITKAITRRDLP